MKTKTNGVDAPGASPQNTLNEIPDQETVEKWLTRDLQSAIACLQAIQQDQGMKTVMAEWMLGRMQNHYNKAANPIPGGKSPVIN